MKDTRLDDSASIYSKREENASSKEKWSTLNGAEKWQFFKDYYLKKLIIAIAVTILAVWFLVSALSPKPESALYAAFITSSMDEDTTEQFTKDLEDYLEIDPEKQEITIDTSLFITDDNSGQADMASQQKLTVYIYAGDVDIIIGNRSIMENYIKSGYFTPLDSILPEDLASSLKDHFVMGKYTDQEDEKNSDASPQPYGLSLKDFPVFESLHTGMADPVLAVVSNSDQKEHAVAAIRYLTN